MRAHERDTIRLDFFKEVRGFLTSLLGVVDGNLGGFLGPLCYVLARVGRGMTGELKCVLGPVAGFDCYSLADAINMSNGSVHRLDPIFADAIDLDRCLLGALGSVVRDYFCPFLESVKCVIGSCSCFLDTMDSGLVDKLNGMFAAIIYLDHHRLGGRVQLGNGSMDSTYHAPD